MSARRSHLRSPQALALVLTALAVAACTPREPAGDAGAEASDAARPPRAVAPEGARDKGRWTAARSAEGAALLSVPARAVAPPDARAELAVALDARVARVHAHLGQAVEEGAPLVDVVMPAAADAAAQLLSARLRLQAYEAVAERLASLDAQGLTTITERTDVEVQRAAAMADLYRARATLSAAGLREAEASGLVESGGRVVLKSPIAGRVSEVSAVPGAFVSPGSEALVRVVAASARRIEARIPPGAMSLVTGGFLPQQGVARPARREGCLSAVERSDDTLRCFFTLEGDPLPADAPGVLQLSAGEGAPLVLVSATAVALDETGPFVWRRDREGARARVPVEVKGRLGRDALLGGALQPGDLLWGDAAHLPEEAP